MTVRHSISTVTVIKAFRTRPVLCKHLRYSTTFGPHSRRKILPLSFSYRGKREAKSHLSKVMQLIRVSVRI